MAPTITPIGPAIVPKPIAPIKASDILSFSVCSNSKSRAPGPVMKSTNGLATALAIAAYIPPFINFGPSFLANAFAPPAAAKDVAKPNVKTSARSKPPKKLFNLFSPVGGVISGSGIFSPASTPNLSFSNSLDCSLNRLSFSLSISTCVSKKPHIAFNFSRDCC